MIHQHFKATGSLTQMLKPAYIAMLSFVFFTGTVNAQNLIINKVAGNGSLTYAGNGSLAVNTGMDPSGLAFNSSGDMYITDYTNNSVRKVDHITGITTTVAGNGTAGFSGDGGPAVSAQLNAPGELVLNAADDLFICDYNNNRIRKVDHNTGIISTIAGTGTTSGYSGDGGPAVNAKLYHPNDLLFNSAGNLYIADFGNDVVRSINLTTNIITTVIGSGSSGYSGDGGPAINATFTGLGNLAFNSAGDLYIDDYYNYVVRKVDHITGIITTIAGNGTSGYSGDGGPATSAQFHQPTGLAVDAAGDIFVSDFNNNRIRKIDHLTGTVTTVVGNGTIGYSGDGGLATSAQVDGPDKLIFNASGELFVCDSYNRRVRKITTACSDYVINSTASFSYSGCVTDSASAMVNTSHYISGVYDNSCTTSVTCSIEWGDGNTSLQAMSCTGNYSALLKHKYLNPGTYTYKVTFNGVVCSDSIVGSINVNSCGNLIGTVYNDLNNDCIQNGSEPGLGNVPLKATSGSNVFLAWTNASGIYSFPSIPAGTYTIQINGSPSGYTITCTNSMPHATLVTNTGTTTENFALYCGFYDVAVLGISEYFGFFPGQVDAVLPQVGILNNACNFSIPGKVKVILSPCLTYTTLAGHYHPAPNSIIPAPGGDTLVWNVADINNIGSFSYYDYWAHVAVCTNAQVGDTACITVMVLPTNGDANPANNSLTRCFAIGVSYDPNFKEVSPKGEGAQGYIPQATNELTYTLHFQNTGTARASNIYLLDTINSNLDISSIELVSASHSVQPYLLPNRTMKFMFANIMLPDSTHDEEHSHGYVTYRIKTNPMLLVGTKIKNTGYIYFDYNAPVATNTTLNTIKGTTSISEKTKGIVEVYPNPTNALVNIRSNNIITKVTVINILGEVVKTEALNGHELSVDMSDLKPNVYFLQITDSENHTSTQKIVKE